MNITRSLEIIKYKAGDLVRYTLQDKDEISYGVVENDCKFLHYIDGDEIVGLWKQSTVPFGERKEGVYVRNVHENFGQITFKQYMHDNPERFI